MTTQPRPSTPNPRAGTSAAELRAGLARMAEQKAAAEARRPSHALAA